MAARGKCPLPGWFQKVLNMKVQAERIKHTIEVFQNADELDLAMLMEDARFLACQLYPFSELVGAAKRSYNEAHVARKLKFAQLVAHYRDTEKLNVSDSERRALQHPEHMKLYEQEYTEEARYEQGKLMLRAMQEVHSRMTQEAAELRYEKKQGIDEEMMERIVKKINEQNRSMAQYEPH